MSKAYRHMGSDYEASGRDSVFVRTSSTVAKVERVAAGTVLAGVFGVVVLNVAARGIGQPVIWADEMAIYGMAWVAFIGSSAALSGRDHIAITLLSDAVSGRSRQMLATAVDGLLLVLLGVLAIVLWRWFDPITYLSAESGQAYAVETFNFMHQEPTTTLGIAKIWVWLILPVFNLTALLHVSARLFAGPVQEVHVQRRRAQ